jgi:hypothetical protein
MNSQSMSHGAWWFLLFIVTGHPVRAQETASVGSFWGGPNLAMGKMPSPGIHVQLAVGSPRGRSIGVRVEGLALASLTAMADPLCIASPCHSFSDPYPVMTYAGSLTLVASPTSLTPRLYGLASVGRYHGTGYKSTREEFGTTTGASVGVGLAPGAVAVPGLGREVSVEVRYHHLFGGLGRMRGVLVSSLGLLFF